MLLSLIVGLVGGVYGIGGGAIMAPFLVSFFGLPVHAVAGASLFATFLTSVAGVGFYSLLAPLHPAWLWPRTGGWASCWALPYFRTSPLILPVWNSKEPASGGISGGRFFCYLQI